MEALTALLSTIRAGFGRGFVMAGLIPSVILLLGWEWYRQGNDGVRHFVSTVSTSAADATSVVLLTVSGVCLLGFLFFVSRTLWLRLFQTLPGPWLLPLRRYLLTRQRARRAAIDKHQSDLQWTLTVFRWLRMGLEPSPQYSPDGLRHAGLRDTLRDSARLRKSLAESPAALVTDASLATLRDLHHLALVHHDNDGVKAELAAWQVLGREPWFPQRLATAESELKHRWSDTYMALQSYPSAQWIQPTRLGNVLAAVDDYAEKRYGIPTTTLWTRLWGVLAEEERHDVQSAELAIATLVNVCMAAATLVVCVALRELAEIRVIIASRHLATLDARACVSLALGSLATIGSYHAAVYSCSEWATRVIRLVDLRRLHLIAALGFEAPDNVREERILFQELRGFFIQASGLDSERRLKPPGT